MKKRVLITLLIVLMAVPVFAASSRIGASSGYKVDYTRITDNTDYNEKLLRLYTTFSIDGATYFGGNFGIGYGASLNVPFAGTINKQLFSSSDKVYFSTNFAPYFEFLYALPLADNLSLEIGAGASADLMYRRFNENRVSTYRFNALVSASLVVSFTDHFALQLIERLDVPVYSIGKIAGTNVQLKDYGISGTTSVGLSYLY